MGLWTDAALSRTRASVSKALADREELRSGMLRVELEAKAAATADSVVTTLSHLPGATMGPLEDIFDVALSRTNAWRMRTGAELDDLKAELDAVEARLSFAQKSDTTLNKVVDGTTEAKRKVSEDADRLLAD
jgi:hypothetical protein